MEWRPVDECVSRVMAEMSKTCLLTLATTAIGFGSLLMARSELLQLLAIQSVLGMVCNYICLILILCSWFGAHCPIFASVIKLPDSLGAFVIVENRTPGLWDRVGQFVCSYAPAIIAVHLLAAAGAVIMATNMQVNSYMFETYKKDHPVVQITEILDEKMSGLVTLEVQLTAEHRELLFDTDMVSACQKVRDELQSDNRISFCRDYVELLSAFDRRILSDNADTVQSALKRVSRLLTRLQRKDTWTSFLAAEQPKARIMLRVRDLGSSGFKALFADVDAVLTRELPAGVTYQLTGDAWLHTVCMDQFVRDLFYSLIAASGIIFVLIGLLFRSVRTGLISSIPNLFPLTMTLGYMYLCGYELTAGNVIVFAISLGIAVDDTIHFLARYREESKRATDHVAIVTGSLRSSGRAIILTSCLVISGLSVLIFSEFLPTRRFAELTAITMCAALPGDVILLPAMLSLLRRRTT